MKRALGIIGIFVAILIYSIVFAENFTTGINLMQVTQRTALYSVLALGAALVIVTGGIDLSIGSVVCLSGIMTRGSSSRRSGRRGRSSRRCSR